MKSHGNPDPCLGYGYLTGKGMGRGKITHRLPVSHTNFYGCLQQSLCLKPLSSLLGAMVVVVVIVFVVLVVVVVVVVPCHAGDHGT